jgi:4-hydroxybenzoate polyprenyltransferase
MAYLLANQSWTPTIDLGLLILASSCLYLGGMVLNDVFDFEVDLIERPQRPLPAKQISRDTARWVGYGLLLSGVTLASLAGWAGNHGSELTFASPLVRCFTVSVLLAICIVLYDGPLKKTILAPGLMGTCRSLNILLGASTFIPLATSLDASSNPHVLGLPQAVWWIALAVGVMISGVTLLGRREAVDSQPRFPLAMGAAMVITGLIGLALVVYCPTTFEISGKTKQLFPLFVCLISLTIARRVIEAAVVASPKKIQSAIISVLKSVIIFDALICYLVAPFNLMYALVVVALLIPSILLSKAISST